MQSFFFKRHVLVTGGGRGIGGAIADRFASLGAEISLVGRDRETLHLKAEDLRARHGISVHICSADISDHAQVTEAFLSCEQTFGPVEFLINNAGLVESAPFHKTGVTVWDKMIGINLNGVYYCTSHVIPKMLESGFGRVVNIASTAGLVGYRYVSAYCAAKHGVVGLTKALALETAGRGITVNAICPGYTDTDLISVAAQNIAQKTKQSESQVKETFVSNVPQGRFIQPTEIASATVWLCEQEQESITGTTINISGGEVL